MTTARRTAAAAALAAVALLYPSLADARYAAGDPPPPYDPAQLERALVEGAKRLAPNFYTSVRIDCTYLYAGGEYQGPCEARGSRTTLDGRKVTWRRSYRMSFGRSLPGTCTTLTRWPSWHRALVQASPVRVCLRLRRVPLTPPPGQA
jgi:hypothetical protein